MTTENILIIGGLVLLVLLVAMRIFRRAREQDMPSGGYRAPSGPRPTAVPPSAARRNWLVGLEGEVAGKTFHVGARTVTIGRGVSNFVQVVGGDTSRVHCQLTPVPQGLQVKDMGSTNGTYINGARVTLGTLSDGDELAVGNALLRYQQFGQFQVDYGLEGKVAGRGGDTQAISASAINVVMLARQALDESGGDVDEAARRMGITPDALRGLLGH